MDKRFGTPATTWNSEMSESVSIQHPNGLTSGDFTEADEPLRLFAAWLSEASRSEPADPNAMTLATVDPDGLPNARMVLLKGFDEQGFVFYTNLDSQKGRELDGTPKGALVFHWKSLSRQVRLRGPVERVEDQVADAYFATRPRLAQISRLRSKAGWPSRRRSPSTWPDSPSERYRDRRTGPATGCCHRSSNSGKIDPIGYTIASSSAATEPGSRGARRGSIPNPPC
jgi:pyridoxine/pyridoxamine 5'-phosphate oxidase